MPSVQLRRCRTPLLQGVAAFHQHEGRVGKLTRADASVDTIDYRPESFEFTVHRDEMKRFDLEAIQRKLVDVAERIGQSQTKRMLEVAGEAADSVGNVVHAGGELTQEACHALKILRRGALGQ